MVPKAKGATLFSCDLQVRPVQPAHVDLTGPVYLTDAQTRPSLHPAHIDLTGPVYLTDGLMMS